MSLRDFSISEIHSQLETSKRKVQHLFLETSKNLTERNRKDRNLKERNLKSAKNAQNVKNFKNLKEGKSKEGKSKENQSKEEWTSERTLTRLNPSPQLESFSSHQNKENKLKTSIAKPAIHTPVSIKTLKTLPSAPLEPVSKSIQFNGNASLPPRTTPTQISRVRSKSFSPSRLTSWISQERAQASIQFPFKSHSTTPLESGHSFLSPFTPLPSKFKSIETSVPSLPPTFPPIFPPTHQTLIAPKILILHPSAPSRSSKIPIPVRKVEWTSFHLFLLLCLCTFKTTFWTTTLEISYFM